MILGITGSFGSGKGTVVEYLVRQKGFRHYSATALLIEEIERRGMPVNRDSMIAVANDLRARGGPSYLVDTLYKRAAAADGDAIIEALRAVAEVRRIKEFGGVVLGVDADSRLRYQRIVMRGGVKDDVTYEEFLDQERKESNPDDPAKQDIFGALKESDVIIENSGTLDELHAQIDDALARVTK